MRHIAKFLSDRRAATAVEFAIVSSLFIFIVLFTMTVCAISYINLIMDNATTRAARLILTGNLQSQAQPTLSTFKASLCGLLPATFSCSNVFVNLYVVPKATSPSGYYTYANSNLSGLTIPALTAGSGQFTLGSQGDYQYLQVTYPVTALPSLFTTMLSRSATYNGKPAYVVVSTAAFRNERYQ